MRSVIFWTWIVLLTSVSQAQVATVDAGHYVEGVAYDWDFGEGGPFEEHDSECYFPGSEIDVVDGCLDDSTDCECSTI